MEEGKGKLIIQTSKENNDCLLSITDNGTGIKEEDLPHLFDPFFSKKAKGMGLGLTTTQNIIQSHKGTIQATSQLGKGTTFTLRFPQLR